MDCTLTSVAIIAVVIPVPAMFMFAPAVIAFPVAIQIAIPFISRCNPTCAGVSRARPVSGMPSVVAPHWIPIAVNPDVGRTGPNRPNAHHARGRRRPNPNAQGYLAEKCSSNH